MVALSRLLSFTTWLDFALTLALLMTIAVRAATDQRLVSPTTYRWAIGVGLLCSCSWWVLVFCGYYGSSHLGGTHPHPGGTGEGWALNIVAVLPAAVLGALSGLLGGIELSTPWRVVSMVIGVPNVFAVATVGWLLIRARLFG